jgi:hypothetical protein
MSTKAQIPSLVSTMLICQWKKLNVVKRSACSWSCPTWNLTSHTIMIKVSRIPSWVLMCSLPWVQCKRWIPIWSMGCVHTNQKILRSERCGSLNHIWNVVEKIREDNWKVKKIGQIIRQSPIPRLEHDNIQAWWATYILSRSMLERVWWCKWFEMKSWSQTICCLMSCSKRRKHTHVEGGRRLYLALKCY